MMGIAALHPSLYGVWGRDSRFTKSGTALPLQQGPENRAPNDFGNSEISLANRPKSLLYRSPSRPKRGALRTSSTRGGMRWTLAARETSAACWRTAKSCRSDAPMPASSLREGAQATVSNKPGHRGEREVSRKTIARGMPGLFRCDRGDYARVLCLISHARLRVHWAPGIPCALCFSGASGLAKPRADHAAGSRGRI